MVIPSSSSSIVFLIIEIMLSGFFADNFICFVANVIDTSSTPSIVFNLLSILAAQFAQSRPSRIYIFVFDTPFTFLFFGTSTTPSSIESITACILGSNAS